MPLDPTFAPLKNNIFQIALFSFRTQNGFEKAALFVSKVSVRNSYTQKYWVERLIYFLRPRPHVANRSRLTLMNVEKRHVSCSVNHFFLLLSSSQSILGVRKKCIRSLVGLNRSKKNYICSVVRLNRSKKNCIRSAVQPIRFKRLVKPFLIRSLAVRSAVRTNTVRNVFA